MGMDVVSGRPLIPLTRQDMRRGVDENLTSDLTKLGNYKDSDIEKVLRRSNGNRGKLYAEALGEMRSNHYRDAVLLFHASAIASETNWEVAEAHYGAFRAARDAGLDDLANILNSRPPLKPSKQSCRSFTVSIWL